jgi:hypothetical protein
MKHYRYTRDLDGSPEGTVRALASDDVAALVLSGALVETDEAVTDAPVVDADPIAPITGASVAEPAKPAPARAPRAAKPH